MKLFISDTNIFIDLFRIDLIDLFFEMDGVDIKTTDFVIEEIRDPTQQAIMLAFISQKQLEVIVSEDVDIVSILQLRQQHKKLSVEDCSVWYYAKKLNGILLTGDGQLRKQSLKSHIEIRGILYLFDLLIAERKLSYETAILKLKELAELNSRLPENEVRLRLEDWSTR
jgi:predicted nucleic acid-binding protein